MRVGQKIICGSYVAHSTQHNQKKELNLKILLTRINSIITVKELILWYYCQHNWDQIIQDLCLYFTNQTRSAGWTNIQRYQSLVDKSIINLKFTAFTQVQKIRSVVFVFPTVCPNKVNWKSSVIPVTGQLREKTSNAQLSPHSYPHSPSDALSLSLSPLLLCHSHHSESYYILAILEFSLLYNKCPLYLWANCFSGTWPVLNCNLNSIIQPANYPFRFSLWITMQSCERWRAYTYDGISECCIKRLTWHKISPFHDVTLNVCWCLH